MQFNPTVLKFSELESVSIVNLKIKVLLILRILICQKLTNYRSFDFKKFLVPSRPRHSRLKELQSYSEISKSTVIRNKNFILNSQHINIYINI